MKKTILFVSVAAMLIVFAGCNGSSGPEAPTGLTVTGNAPITLSWNSVSGATSYNVYRGTISGGLSTKTRLASNDNATTYTDMSATVGITYYYQVTAEDSNGVSDASNEVTATSQSQNGNSNSNSFVLIGSKSGSGIVLSWSNVSGAVSYNVYRDTISAFITHKTKIASGILTTTYTDAVVTSGNTYYYQVTAVNASGIETEGTDETSVTF
jgi:fibronectin type 3 domain-containing protein